MSRLALAELTQEYHGALGGVRGLGSGNGANSIEDEVDDCESENGNNKTDDRIQDCIFRIGDFFAVAAGHDVAEAAPDKHDDGNDTNDVEDGIGNSSENAIDAN